MGCDGGTIPRRDELVRVKKKPEQVRISKIQNNVDVYKNLLFVMFSLQMFVYN